MFFLISLIALFDLVLCGFLVVQHHATLPVFALAWLFLAAVGITISWVTMPSPLIAGDERYARHAQNVFMRLFVTVGFLLLALGWILKA